ncbi:MAG: hypothetical protein OQK82_00275 [Candidatus Pacearchaeota archaeon]|nr:hypothetical protein [Candidatus Pacearchaeota archaeon]
MFEYSLSNYPIDIVGHIFQPSIYEGLGNFTKKQQSRLIKAINKNPKHQIFVEINGNPSPSGMEKGNQRYDVDFFKKMINEKIKLTIGSDAHQREHIGIYPVDVIQELNKCGKNYLQDEISIKNC